MTSAFVANDTTLATLQALRPGLVILSDAQNHASMIAAPRTGAINNRWSKNQRLLHLLTTTYVPQADFGCRADIWRLARVKRTDGG